MPSNDKKQLTDVQIAREKRQKASRKQLKKYILRGNGIKPALLTLLLTVGAAYVVYTEISVSDGFDSEEVYKLNNVAMSVETAKGFEGRVLTVAPTLTVYGEEKLVKQMKAAEIIPDIELNAKKMSEGVYEITPEVKDKKIKVNYSFTPSTMEVQVFKAEREEYDVLERFYGVAKEGYYIERIIAQEKAELLVTGEEALQIGYVVADISTTKITATGMYEADVVVLDKKGQLIDLPLVKPTIKVEVTYSELPWYQRQKDVKLLKEEIKTLERELKERREKLPTLTDVLQRSDLQKEITFRETRLPLKQKELIDKETGLSEAKANEESLKLQQAQKALKDGGTFVELEE